MQMTVAVSGWVWALPFAAMALVCPLMMLSMVAMAFPWVRRLFGRADAGGGHSMMMCHGASHGGDSRGEHPARAGAGSDAGLLAELRAQRDALDRLIERAETAANAASAGAAARRPEQDPVEGPVPPLRAVGDEAGG